MRCTLVGQSETKLSQGRCSRRDAASLHKSTRERLRSSRECFEGHKLNAYGLKYMLDCIDQEWRLLYMQQSTYSKGRVSVEGYITGRNMMSKKEHVSNTIETDRRRRLSADKNKSVSNNE